MLPIENIRSLGLRSDLMIAVHKSVVEQKDNYIVVKSPHNPGYYWGNYLLFNEPPTLRDAQLCHAKSWEYLFQHEFADISGIKHNAFVWDCPEGIAGDVDEFRALGYSVDTTEVLTANHIFPALHTNGRIRIREMTTVDQWDAVKELLILTREPQHQERLYRRYIERKVETYRSMAMKKNGAWFGAFLGTELVGTLGIFTGYGVARFQHVVTHPAFRRRGVCGTLVYEIGSLALTRDDVDCLVMQADPEYHAARLYRSLGFEVTELLYSLEKVNNSFEGNEEVTQEFHAQPSI